MCFTTEIDDPTQQPIRITQTTEAHDSEDSGDMTKVHKPGTKSGQDIMREEDKEQATAGWGKKFKGSAQGFGESPQAKSRAYTQAELQEIYRQRQSPRAKQASVASMGYGHW
jgi:hypothetical protein